MLKLRDVLSRWEAAELSQTEAAGLLGGGGQRFRQAKACWNGLRRDERKDMPSKLS
jgi:hypothetical protein